MYAKGCKFHSFKKVASEMGVIGASDKGHLQLASFHSVSKGFLGECVPRPFLTSPHLTSPLCPCASFALSMVMLCVPSPLLPWHALRHTPGA